VTDGMGRLVHQVGAVVEGDDFHSRREQAAVQGLEFLLELAQCGQGLFAALEQDDTLDHVVGVIHAHLAKPRLIAFVNVGDVAEENGNVVVLGDQRVAHVLNGLQQAHAANVEALAAQGHVAAAGVGIAGGDGGDGLGQSDAVLQELSRIDFGDVFAGAAAKGGNVDNSGNLLHFAGDEPILGSFEFVQAVLRAVEPVPKDFSDGRFRRELRTEVGGEGG
jgi:hypothetical protein